ncbi:MAG: hypothetical protein KZQ93_17070 [Candidatus Thiodiazotropha sp. (ex Monitilora ramsayi)]|nr:hypothetical protein [Candidatus Thiodiazotropha sp. (ex Monitilora ramsayi)]
MRINPADITFGQKPESQFPPKRFYGGYREGDWDLETIPVESHLLYQSYVQHFIDGDAWEHTPFFQFAMQSIENGVPFRDEYDSMNGLKLRFQKCDRLYESVKKDGYKSNHQLYAAGIIQNKLELLDEVTVNIARDKTIILNDGWHRFATTRILEIPEITVRVCARHSSLER